MGQAEAAQNGPEARHFSDRAGLSRPQVESPCSFTGGWRSFPMCILHHQLLKLISSWLSGSALCITRGGATGAIASGEPAASASSNASVPEVAPVT
jgi:hypothetical protein